MRERVSAFIITFNEEERILDCLKSLAFCDEIVVIDSFSKDQTCKIAEDFGAKVIQRAWPGYKLQKSFGLTSVSNDWVINLDADERVDETLQKSILEKLELIAEKKNFDPQGREITGYQMNRVVYHLGKWWRKGGWYPEYRLRFFKRSTVTWGGNEPHEKPETAGIEERLKGELLHYSYRNLNDQLQRLRKYAEVAANEDFKRGKRCTILKVLLNPLVRIFKFYIIKKGFLEGVPGIVVAGCEGYYTFMKYALLWEASKGYNKEL